MWTSYIQNNKIIVAPIKPAEKTFDDIVKLMSEHYNPKPTPTVQRCLFNARSRKQGETVAKFIAELKRLTEYCEFGDRLDEMMRDRLVCGINEERWQKRLLAEPNLTYKKAIDIAQALETAEKNVKDISNGKDMPPPRIHHVGYKERERSQIHKPGVGGKEVTSSTSSYSCYRCNGSHKATECRFKEATCHYCGKLGHIVEPVAARNSRVLQMQATDPPPNHLRSTTRKELITLKSRMKRKIQSTLCIILVRAKHIHYLLQLPSMEWRHRWRLTLVLHCQ